MRTGGKRCGFSVCIACWSRRSPMQRRRARSLGEVRKDLRGWLSGTPPTGAILDLKPTEGVRIKVREDHIALRVPLPRGQSIRPFASIQSRSSGLFLCAGFDGGVLVEGTDDP